MNLKLFPSAQETIHATSAALHARQRTCTDVLEQCLARVDEWEPRVRAWVSLDRAGALELAKERDRELSAGRSRGPLHGIPLGIKDLYNICGLPTAAGSKLLASEAAKQDAFVIRRLRDAGAILLGKTVTTLFASFDPPITRNPWNLERTPGGSSSGSAAAVATGMCLGALGSQTGGSITRPASFCGVAGFKPSHGRVSVRGVFPLAPNMDHVGPIARCVRDLAILLDAIAAPDAEDAGCCQAPPPSFTSALDAPLRAPRLGRPHGLFDSKAAPAALIALEKALSALVGEGAVVCDAPLPAGFDTVLQQHRAIMAAESAAFHGPRMSKEPQDYLPCIRMLIEEGLALTATDYIRSRQFQGKLEQDIAASFAGLDVLVTPATIGPAPDAATTGDPAFNSPWSFTGLPTVNLPVCLDDSGLPLGIQLVGRRFDEAGLLRAALWCEKCLGGAHSSR